MAPVKSYSPQTFKPILNKLVLAPHAFTSQDVKDAMEHIARKDSVTPEQVGSFLTALKLTGKEHAAETLTAAAGVMRDHAMKATLSNPEEFIVDIVGTGGDGHNTFNVSTTSAIVAAGAGARVYKVSYDSTPCIEP